MMRFCLVCGPGLAAAQPACPLCEPAPSEERIVAAVAAASAVRFRGASLREVAQRLWPRLRWAPLREGEPAAIDGPALELQQRLDELVRAGVIQAGPLAPDEVDEIAARTYRA